MTTQSVDLTAAELRLIETALETQEKILAVQSRAGRDEAATKRLHNLQAVLRNVQRQAPQRADTVDKDAQLSWTDAARGWFS